MSTTLPTHPTTLPTLSAFQIATRAPAPRTSKAYTLIVCISPSQNHILLGLKNRGFGTGKYNSFGGKIEPGEEPTDGAVRELHEETGITTTSEYMKTRKIGVLTFTFADAAKAMIVHLYAVDLDSPSVECATIIPCEEITPEYFDIPSIPYSNMFNDDTTWLPMVLANFPNIPSFNGYFHFHPDAETVNQVEFIFIDYLDTREKTLFNDLHSLPSQTSSQTSSSHGSRSCLKPKEFNESFAFATHALKTFKPTHVIDVAGGHGAIAMLSLILSTATRTATIIDPAPPDSHHRLQQAWERHVPSHKSITYQRAPLQTALGPAIAALLKTHPASSILVVACHACQHLTTSLLTITSLYGIAAAVMPCCQVPSQSLKAFARNGNLDPAMLADVSCVGVMEEKGYEVCIKALTKASTPMNRIISCKFRTGGKKENGDVVVKKLEDAYFRAHRQLDEKHRQRGDNGWKLDGGLMRLVCAASLMYNIASLLN